jgi:hypothetical protein
MSVQRERTFAPKLGADRLGRKVPDLLIRALCPSTPQTPPSHADSPPLAAVPAESLPVKGFLRREFCLDGDRESAGERGYAIRTVEGNLAFPAKLSDEACYR